jgi:hypothetical protein
MLLGSKARPVREDDNLIAICELTVYTMLDPQHLTILQTSTAYYGYRLILLYRDKFTYLMRKRKSEE